jgi:N-acetyl-anhydromuramyl-L-alanine amidase AmpD
VKTEAFTDSNGVALVPMKGLPDGPDYAIGVIPPDDQLTRGRAGPGLAIGTAQVLYRPLLCRRVAVKDEKLDVSLGFGVPHGDVHGDFFHDGFTGLRVLVDLKPEFMRAPPIRSSLIGALPTPRMIVLHHTGDEKIGNTLDAFLEPTGKPDVRSAHYVVDVDGHAVKMIPEDQRSGHIAGTVPGGSRETPEPWRGLDVTSMSISFEIVHGSGNYSDAQARVVGEIVAAIRASKTSIPRRHVLGHGDIQEGKAARDPGTRFFWRHLEDLGQAILAGPSAPVPPGIEVTMYGGFFLLQAGVFGLLQFGATTATTAAMVRELQKDLADFGYDVSETGNFDGRTSEHLKRFQRRAFARHDPTSVTEPPELKDINDSSKLAVFDLETARRLKGALADIAAERAAGTP